MSGKKLLFYNGSIHTQAGTRHKYARLVVDSMAVDGNRVVAVGNSLKRDPEFKSYTRINLKGKAIIPGLVDAHTHFVYWAMTLTQISLQAETTIAGCLAEIKKHASKLGHSEWIVGEGYRPTVLGEPKEPIRFQLDRISGGRPLFIFSKDQHSAWVNSRALELAGIHTDRPDPRGGKFGRADSGEPNGILYEGPAESLVLSRIPTPDNAKLSKPYSRALKIAYSRGVTGIHSMDSPEFFGFFSSLAENGKIGLRVNYYPGVSMLDSLERTNTTYGTGTEFFRIAGIKIFADGSLGSKTALCFKPYAGHRKNFGIEVTTVPQMKRLIRRAAKLGLPSAIHAIGDKAVSNVLDAFETAPKLAPAVRHRIEHTQLTRRSDIQRLKRLRVIGSMQPSHCLSDIETSRELWGKRSANAFLFRSLLDAGVDLAFGSDVPIEPLHPIDGIAAAVRRARPGSRDIFYPQQRISATEALYAFTAGPAIAAGEADRRGYLLPGYPADFVILDRDITRAPATKITAVTVLATFLNGQIKFQHSALKL